MNLVTLQRGLDIVKDRFGLLTPYTIRKGDESELYLFEGNQTALDESGERILVHPDTNEGLGNIFHSVLYTAFKADQCKRRIQEKGKDGRYFASVENSKYFYGSVIYYNFWFATYYSKLFSDFKEFNEGNMRIELEKNQERKDGFSLAERFYNQAGTPKAHRGFSIFLAQPDFNEVDDGVQDALVLKYKGIIDILRSRNWPIKVKLPIQLPDDLMKWATNVFKLSKIADVKVEAMRTDAYTVIKFLTDPKNQIEDDLKKWLLLAKEILEKKRYYESLYDPKSSNYLPTDSLNVTEAFARVIEWWTIMERTVGETEIVLEKDITLLY